MSMAWKVTREDVENVLNENGVTVVTCDHDEERYDVFVDECYELIDTDKVEHDVLYGNDMSAQVDYANLSIYEQLVDADKI